ncbi:Glu/Leu/Phe/Val dehydrogenase [Candidatus Woesearchaeota archaeon]|nr:Glu/Leu/Phe/Val dehydrogenase [Candidatus Woesearchaeota archaeon]
MANGYELVGTNISHVELYHFKVNHPDKGKIDTFIALTLNASQKFPGLGGWRVNNQNYSTPQEAAQGSVNLAMGMGHKAAAAGLYLTGGKAVTFMDPCDLTETFIENFGGAVESLGGRYVTAADSGTGPEQMDIIARATQHVVCRSTGSGNPAPMTAYGVWRAMDVAAEKNRIILNNAIARVRGAGGQVATSLIFGFPDGHEYDSHREQFRGLARSVRKVYCSETNEQNSSRLRDRIQREGLEGRIILVPDDELYQTNGSIFVPCALGGSASGEKIQQLVDSNCKLIVGAENNQLVDPDSEGGRLQRNGICYITDWVANAGGLINAAEELNARREAREYDVTRVLQKVNDIGDTVNQLLKLMNWKSPSNAAFKLATVNKVC